MIEQVVVAPQILDENPAEILRLFRKSMGLSIEGVCRRYRVNVRTWKRWESQKETASPNFKDHFQLLADLYAWRFSQRGS